MEDSILSKDELTDIDTGELLEISKRARSPWKVYVRVVAEYDAEGMVTPLQLFWSDDTCYRIDRVLDVCNAASRKAGGYGLRYTVRLSCEEAGLYGKVRYLWLEKGLTPERWFVEGKG